MYIERQLMSIRMSIGSRLIHHMSKMVLFLDRFCALCEYVTHVFFGLRT
ncbi:hypothetical protein Avbf_14962, partial [Armadillidium vulgare]